MTLNHLKVAVCFTILALCNAMPAEEPDIVPPTNRPNPEQLRERARKRLDERPKMEREFRERNGVQGTNRATWEKRREELRKLPPGEREAKLKELRRQIQQGEGNFRTLAPEEREAKKAELRKRVDAQINEMRRRQNEGLLNEPEKRRLERMEQMSKRLGRSKTTDRNSNPELPAPRPPASPAP